APGPRMSGRGSELRVRSEHRPGAELSGSGARCRRVLRAGGRLRWRVRPLAAGRVHGAALTAPLSGTCPAMRPEVLSRLGFGVSLAVVLARINVIALNTYREAVRARILHGLFGLAIATGGYSLVVGAYSVRNHQRVVSD